MGLGALAGMSGGPAHRIEILAMSSTNSNAPSRSLPLASPSSGRLPNSPQPGLEVRRRPTDMAENVALFVDLEGSSARGGGDGMAAIDKAMGERADLLASKTMARARRVLRRRPAVILTEPEQLL